MDRDKFKPSPAPLLGYVLEQVSSYISSEDVAQIFKSLFGNSRNNPFHLLSGFVHFVRLYGKGTVLGPLDWCLNLSGVGRFICLVVLADVAWILLRFMIRLHRRLELRTMRSILYPRRAVRSSNDVHRDSTAMPLSTSIPTGNVITITQDQFNLFLGFGISSFTLIPNTSGPRVVQIMVSSKFRISAIRALSTDKQQRHRHRARSPNQAS